MVLLTSRLGHFTATSQSSCSKCSHPKRFPFSRSYGDILPSSLTRDHPITLVYSTRLPVSVCGTVTLLLARGFSRQYSLNSVALSQRRKLPFGSRCSHKGCERICLLTIYGLRRCFASRSLALCVPPSLRLPEGRHAKSGTGI